MSSDRGQIEAVLQSAGARGSSNPFVRCEAGGDRLYFGSLHNHSAIGGHAAGPLRAGVRLARDVTRLDFFALTEHAGAPHFHWPALRAHPIATSCPVRS
ncbi:MAG: hypothetical protein U1E76_12015 [Planctomycetota bacterium]